MMCVKKELSIYLGTGKAQETSLRLPYDPSDLYVRGKAACILSTMGMAGIRRANSAKARDKPDDSKDCRRGKMHAT